MWSRRAFLGGLLPLAACGFTPVLARDGAAGALRGATTVETPDTIAGFRLKDAVTRRLGIVTAPRYTLTLTYAQDVDAAAISTAGDTTRFSVIGRSEWTLTEAGRTVASGEVGTFTGYDATGSTVATQTAAEDARLRLANGLADLVLADVTLALAAP